MIFHFEELNKLAEKIDPNIKRTPYEQQIYSLNQGLTLYHRVMHSLHPLRSKEGLDNSLMSTLATKFSPASHERIAQAASR